MRIAVVLLLGVLLAPACVRAQTAPPSPVPTISFKDLGQLYAALSLELPTRPFEQPTPLSRVLVQLQEQLPKKHRLPIKLDAKTFGKRLPTIAATPISLSGFSDRMNLHTILRYAASKIPGTEAALALHPTHITVTTKEVAEAAQYVMVHDVTPLMKKADALHHLWKKRPSVFDLPERPTSEVTAENIAGIMAQVIMTDTTSPKHWRLTNPRRGLIEIERDRLRIRTTIPRHEKIADTLTNLARFADLEVRVHSRLLQVNSGFYKKRLAPLFKTPTKTKWAVPIGHALYEDLVRQKPWRTVQRVSLVPSKSETLFSLHRPVPYFGPVQTAGGRAEGQETHLAKNGFSLHAKAVVSFNRMSMRLFLSRTTSELLKITSKKTAGGALVETPMSRTSRVAARLQLDDLQPVLLKINFPATQANKRLVLLVCPMIWIEEEQELIQSGKLPPLPKNADDTPRGKGKKTPLPKTENVKQILQALVADLMKNSRGSYYGTPGDKKAVLVSANDGVPWPSWFRPEVPGYRIRHVHHNDLNHTTGNRLLGIYINRFSLEAVPKTKVAPIEVQVLNAGGSDNGVVIGTGLIWYRPAQHKGRWSVECFGGFDP